MKETNFLNVKHIGRQLEKLYNSIFTAEKITFYKFTLITPTIRLVKPQSHGLDGDWKYTIFSRKIFSTPVVFC